MGGWRLRQALTAALPADSPMQAPPATPAQAPAPGTASPGFPKTAVYEPSPAITRLRLAIAPLLLILPAVLWPLVFDGTPLGVGGCIFLLLAAASVLAVACIVRYARNARFVIGPHGVTIHGLGKAVVLPSSHIEAITPTRVKNGHGYQVKLHAKGRSSPAKVHLDDCDLQDDALLAWLASIPLRGGDPLVRRRPVAGAGQTRRILVTMAALALLPFAWIIVKGPIGEAHDLIVGYPSLQQLSLVEGTLVHVGSCHPGGRGYSAYLPVTIEAASGPSAFPLSCDLQAVLQAPGRHHVAVWRDARLFSDGRVREVDVDGRVVQSYEAYVARSRQMVPYLLFASSMVVVSLGLVLSGLLASPRR
jgi:hypothetical protein